MKIVIPFLVLLFILSCRQNDNREKILESRIDSLENRLTNVYQPGFGEFMSGIQVHHAKLWFAGTNENWGLADFEIHEIMESVDALQQTQTKRPEIKFLPMLRPALDSVNGAIQRKDGIAFKHEFILLTNTCNNCHHEVNYPFNEVKIPDTPPFSNQVFKPAGK